MRLTPDGITRIYLAPDASTGTYNNAPPGPAVTMDAILAAKRALGALGPPPPREFTVAPNVLDELRDLAPPSGVRPVSSAPPRLFRPLDGFEIYVDVRLAPSTWHPGRPRP